MQTSNYINVEALISFLNDDNISDIYRIPIHPGYYQDIMSFIRKNQQSCKEILSNANL